MDERAERVWIHPNLKNLLVELSKIINDKSIEETGYPIPKGLPISSKIAASLLEKIIYKDSFIKVEKLDKGIIFNTQLSTNIKSPIFLIVFDPRCVDKEDIKNFRDKEYLNLNLFKKKGIKENEIEFI